MFFEDLAGSCIGEYKVVGVTYFETPGIEQEAVRSYVEEYEPVAVTCFDHQGGVLQPSGNEDHPIRDRHEQARTECSTELAEFESEIAAPPTRCCPNASQVGLEGLHKLVVRVVFVPTGSEMVEPCLP